MKQKEKMHNYTVTYKIDGQTKVSKVEAVDPGQAFLKTQKEVPAAVMVSVERYGVAPLGGEGWTVWEAPPVQRNPSPEPRPARALKPKERGCEFPFYDEVVRQA